MIDIIVTILAILAFLALIWLFHISAKHDWEERNWWQNPNDNDEFLNE